MNNRIQKIYVFNIFICFKYSIKQPQKQDLKVISFDSDYEITFSLINSKPEEIDSNWNIEYCVESMQLSLF
jgi:hypothetical protein